MSNASVATRMTGARILEPAHRFGRIAGIGRTPLAALLFVDCLLIAADVCRRCGALDDRRFLLTTEWGYGEIAQYLKFASLSVATSIAAIRWRSLPGLGWAVFFAILLCDDALQIHEKTGLALEGLDLLPTIGNLRARDAGELLVAAVLGAAAGSLAVLGLLYGTARDASLAAVAFGGLLLLAVFGVGGDVVHSLARGTAFQTVTAVIEDGGELIATSLLEVAVLGALVASPRRTAIIIPPPAETRVIRREGAA